MRYLGLDLGMRTLGIAISDRTGLIASTYKTLRFPEGEYMSTISELQKISGFGVRPALYSCKK